MFNNIKDYKEFLEYLKDKKVAFVGMGVANTPCAEWLASYGIEVYACDKRDKAYIGEDICARLEELGVHFSLGENYLDVLPDMDIVFRSNGILPFQNNWIGECIERGQTVTSEMEVFFSFCPAKIIAVTGSNGKTTTTTIISEMLKAEGKTVFLGGNIGKALMCELDKITEDDYAVVENQITKLYLKDMYNNNKRCEICIISIKKIECRS